MHKTLIRHACVALALSGCTGAAWAQAATSRADPAHSAAASAASGTSSARASPSPSGTTATIDPADPQARVPLLHYRSGLQAYRPWAEQRSGNWRALNDEVTRIGGWRSYLREVHQAPAARSTPAAPVTPGLRAPAAASPAAPTAAPPDAARTTPPPRQPQKPEAAHAQH